MPSYTDYLNRVLESSKIFINYFSYLNLDCSMVELGHCKDFLDQHERWFHYRVMVQVFLSAGWYPHLFSYLNLDCSMVVLGHCKDFLNQHERWFHYRVMVQVFLSAG